MQMECDSQLTDWCMTSRAGSAGTLSADYLPLFNAHSWSRGGLQYFQALVEKICGPGSDKRRPEKFKFDVWEISQKSMLSVKKSDHLKQDKYIKYRRDTILQLNMWKGSVDIFFLQQC